MIRSSRIIILIKPKNMQLQGYFFQSEVFTYNRYVLCDTCIYISKIPFLIKIFVYIVTQYATCSSEIRFYICWRDVKENMKTGHLLFIMLSDLYFAICRNIYINERYLFDIYTNFKILHNVKFTLGKMTICVSRSRKCLGCQCFKINTFYFCIPFWYI